MAKANSPVSTLPKLNAARAQTAQSSSLHPSSWQRLYLTGPRRVPSSFRGQIWGPDLPNNTTKDRALATVGYALNQERRRGNPNQLWMALFTGVDVPKYTCPPGAYSVVSHDTHHNKLAKMAWHVPFNVPALNNEKRLTALAIAQALQVADQRLRDLPARLKPKKATIKIFVACQETLKNIENTGTIEGVGKEEMVAVVGLIENLSEILCDIPGIDFRVFLQWLPASYAKMQCARDFAKRCRRKTGGGHAYFIGNQQQPAKNLPLYIAGIHAQHEEEKAAKKAAEEAKKAEEEAKKAEEEAEKNAENEAKTARMEEWVDDVVKHTSAIDVDMEEAPVEGSGQVEGHVDAGMEVCQDDENLEEAEVTGSGQENTKLEVLKENVKQAMNGENMVEDDQSLVDQQLFAGFSEHLETKDQNAE